MHLTELFAPNLTERSLPRYAFKAIFVMGPPGSGKNTIIDQHLYNPSFKLDDFDEVMQRVKALRNDEGDYSHSYQLQGQRRNLWLKNTLGIIINTTGRRQNNITELKSVLEEVGYDTFGIFVKAPYDVALQRVMHRPGSSPKIADRNRKVDAEYFDKAYVASMANLKIFKSVFPASNFAVVVNDPDNEYYAPSVANLDRSLKRFLRQPVQNPVGKGQIQSFNSQNHQCN